MPTWREATFAGFFGPIGKSKHPSTSETVLNSTGVGAIFYTQVALEVIPNDGSRDRLRA
jgi:hypothetical protein